MHCSGICLNKNVLIRTIRRSPPREFPFTVVSNSSSNLAIQPVGVAVCQDLSVCFLFLLRRVSRAQLINRRRRTFQTNYLHPGHRLEPSLAFVSAKGRCSRRECEKFYACHNREITDKLLKLAAQADSEAQDPHIDARTQQLFRSCKARLESKAAIELLKDGKSAQKGLKLGFDAIQVSLPSNTLLPKADY